MKESDTNAFITTIAVSTLAICVNLFTAYFLANYFNLVPRVTTSHHIVFFVLTVGFINYYFFIKDRKFLNYSFRKEKRGGALIVLYLFITFVLALTMAHFNRERIFKEQLDTMPNKPRRESLEGKIRKWLEDY